MRKNETIKKEGEEMTNFSRELTAKRIKDLRIKNGYTIEQLADLIGVSKGTVSSRQTKKRWLSNTLPPLIFCLLFLHSFCHL